jgi:hypothetical protein
MVFTILLTHVMLIHQLVSGLITPQTIRNITDVTEECTRKIREKEIIGQGLQIVMGLGGLGEQSVLSTTPGDKDEQDVEEDEEVSLLSNFPTLWDRRDANLSMTNDPTDRIGRNQSPLLHPPR